MGNNVYLNRELLIRFYIKESKSVADIALYFHCSQNKINYWMKNYGIKKRSISDALYVKRNPGGDPFKVRKPATIPQAILYGMGLGLYWGEGTKADTNSIRLGNTDPALICVFIRFLTDTLGVDIQKLRFGLQIFSDSSPEVVIRWWLQHLKVNRSQFQKVIVTKRRGIGTYRRKIPYGVLTVQCHNRKLRNILGSFLDAYRTSRCS